MWTNSRNQPHKATSRVAGESAELTESRLESELVRSNRTKCQIRSKIRCQIQSKVRSKVRCQVRCPKSQIRVATDKLEDSAANKAYRSDKPIDKPIKSGSVARPGKRESQPNRPSVEPEKQIEAPGESKSVYSQSSSENRLVTTSLKSSSKASLHGHYERFHLANYRKNYPINSQINRPFDTKHSRQSYHPTYQSTYQLHRFQMAIQLLFGRFCYWFGQLFICLFSQLLRLKVRSTIHQAIRCSSSLCQACNRLSKLHHFLTCQSSNRSNSSPTEHNHQTAYHLSNHLSSHLSSHLSNQPSNQASYQQTTYRLQTSSMPAHHLSACDPASPANCQPFTEPFANHRAPTNHRPSSDRPFSSVLTKNQQAVASHQSAFTSYPPCCATVSHQTACHRLASLQSSTVRLSTVQLSTPHRSTSQPSSLPHTTHQLSTPQLAQPGNFCATRRFAHQFGHFNRTTNVFNLRTFVRCLLPSLLCVLLVQPNHPVNGQAPANPETPFGEYHVFTIFSFYPPGFWVFTCPFVV